MPAVAATSDAITEMSRDVSQPAGLSEPDPPSNLREREMLDSHQKPASQASVGQSDAIAGALLLGITMQVFAGPVGGLIGAMAGAAAGAAVFSRLFSRHGNGSKRAHE